MPLPLSLSQSSLLAKYAVLRRVGICWHGEPLRSRDKEIKGRPETGMFAAALGRGATASRPLNGRSLAGLPRLNLFLQLFRALLAKQAGVLRYFLLQDGEPLASGFIRHPSKV